MSSQMMQLKKTMLKNESYIAGDDKLETDKDIIQTAIYVIDRMSDDLKTVKEQLEKAKYAIWEAED